MNITSKSKYALRAIIHLARTNNGVMRREDLSIAQGGISKEYLEKILLRLRELNIVEAKSGRGGGYRLAKPAAELTAWDVISAVEESLLPQRERRVLRGKLRSQDALEPRVERRGPGDEKHLHRLSGGRGGRGSREPPAAR